MAPTPNYDPPHHSYDPTVTMEEPTTPCANTVLLVWDAPNIDMGLGNIVGGRPSSQQRPRFDAIARWLVAYTTKLSHETGTTILPEGTIFTNVAQAPGAAEALRPWVDAVRNMGFAVFAKPKITEDSDVDADMVAHIERRYAEGKLNTVVVASADGLNFQSLLERLRPLGVHTWVIGFREHSTWALNSPTIHFLDLENIDGAFYQPLPRISLDTLPAEGAWLPPLRPISLINDHYERGNPGAHATHATRSSSK